MNDIIDEREVAAKITAYLDRGAAGLRPGIAYRLQGARAQALARARGAEAGAVRVGRQGTGVLAGLGHGRWSTGALWIGGLVVAAALLYGWQWNHERNKALANARELAEIDAALLSADVPFDAFLDRGFQVWLTRDEQR